jgi:hypothetical protein
MRLLRIFAEKYFAILITPVLDKLRNSDCLGTQRVMTGKTASISG